MNYYLHSPILVRSLHRDNFTSDAMTLKAISDWERDAAEEM